MLKEIIKAIVRKIVKSNFLYGFLKPLGSLGSYIIKKRLSFLDSLVLKNESKIDLLFLDLVVKNGPFKGMKYNDLKANGSSIYPKLLGSYESELHGKIEALLLEKNYDVILDIGCAEGYYAVGFALRQPKAIIYAFDINEEARNNCRAMALKNNVKNRVVLDSFCSSQTLNTFDFKKESLILCDCEGFEMELFTPDNITNLKKSTIIIETHDCFNIEISTYLKNLFCATHNIESIYSIDDVHKVLNLNCDYHYSELLEINNVDKKTILSEGRKNIMEWLLIEPKVW